MCGVQAALMLAQEAAEDLEDVAEAAYTPSEGGYAQVRLPLPERARALPDRGRKMSQAGGPAA